MRHDGDETFLVEREKVFAQDFAFRYENGTGICQEGALLFTLTECAEEQPVATEAPPHRS